MADLDKLARLIRVTLMNLNTLAIGSRAHQRAWERMTKMAEIPGSLVAEITALNSERGGVDLDAVGWLERIAWEPVQWSDPEFVWDEEEEGLPHPKERVVYIRTLDDRTARWTNASFVGAIEDWLPLPYSAAAAGAEEPRSAVPGAPSPRWRQISPETEAGLKALDEATRLGPHRARKMPPTGEEEPR